MSLNTYWRRRAQQNFKARPAFHHGRIVWIVVTMMVHRPCEFTQWDESIFELIQSITTDEVYSSNPHSQRCPKCIDRYNEWRRYLEWKNTR